MFLRTSLFSVLSKVRICRTFVISSADNGCSVIDGKLLAKELRKNLKLELQEWMGKGHRPPRLVAILIGDNPASRSYVNIKLKAAMRVGIEASAVYFPDTIDEKTLVGLIQEHNEDATVDGILVQLPLPLCMSERVVCNSVAPNKDVDGFSVANIGRLTLNMSSLVPCTALAVLHIIRSTGLPTEGKLAVVCGRSKNVGLPINLILHSHISGEFGGLDMTTTICHRFTSPDQLASLTKQADFIITAAGVPGLIRGDMVKPGACVIDVGMTRIQDKDGKARFIGDVQFDEVSEVAGMITPVPGGVGPVTVAMLLRNTFIAAKHNSLTMEARGSTETKQIINS